jgi:hypothetical protein
MYSLKNIEEQLLNDPKKVVLKDKLKVFPKELYNFKESLEIIDLSDNLLTELPDDLHVFSKLKIIFLSNNPFEVLPEVLGKCSTLKMIGAKACKINTIPSNSLPKSLKWLTLTDNKIKKIPSAIGDCKDIQKLILSGNEIEEIPAEIVSCENLELIRLASNKLEEFPSVLFSLPSLTWLAFSGNPFVKKIESFQLIQFEKGDFEVEHELGNGASGIIYKVSTKENQKFALKVFKGGMTSDGSPEDELNHYLKVGSHPNLVTIIGEVNDFEKGKKAVLFDLIPSDYFNLGNSPSFDSCTRDVMKLDIRFSFSQVLSILNSIVSVCQLMHQKGVLHGDLYAHNILAKADGSVYLGDFGAASSYDETFEAMHLFEKLEVRAFGMLIEDVLKVSELNETQSLKLIQLSKACLNGMIIERPSFSEIEKVLEELIEMVL